MLVRRWLILFSVMNLILVGCVPWPLQVTPAVSGKVIDAEDGHPVAGAKVYLSDFPDKGTESSLDGGFIIKPINKWQTVVVGTDLRSGYSLIVEASGYRRTRQKWEVGDNRNQVIRLEPSDKQ